MADEPSNPDLKPATLTFVWVLTGFSCMMVVARIITKVVRPSGVVFEDYLMLISMVSDPCSILLRSLQPCPTEDDFPNLFQTDAG